MITKEQYIASLAHEVKVIKHLAEKVDATKLDYRPTEKQRSTLELLKYLGQVIHTGVSAYIAGSQDVYMELAKNQEQVTFENFISKMDEQISFAKDAIEKLTDEDMQKESTIWGSTAPLAVHLLHVLQNVTAYKMQLFLYVKASGNHDIGTSNVWAGRDMAPQS